MRSRLSRVKKGDALVNTHTHNHSNTVTCQFQSLSEKLKAGGLGAPITEMLQGMHALRKVCGPYLEAESGTEGSSRAEDHLHSRDNGLEVLGAGAPVPV